MADEINTPVTPTPAPATPVAPVPTDSVQPSVAPAPAVEATPVAPVAESKPETVLGEALTPPVVQPTPDTPAEVTPPVVEPKTTEGQSEEPAPPPVYDAFKLPEGITLKDERVKEFTNVLAELETKSKLDHVLAQEFGQKMVDFHIAEVKQTVENINKYYQDNWERQKVQWKENFLKDPEIGGNRFQTTVDSALTFIRTHGGTPEQQAEFRNLMESSGLGNHSAVIRLLANAGRAMSEGKPLAASKPVSPPKSKTETLYGGSGSQIQLLK